MNLNKTTKYALQVFSLIALDDNKLYTAIELSEKLKIPYRYLRKLMQEFQKNGLLKSVQGKEGGYLLTKPINEISLYEIIMLTDANQMDTHCFFGFEDCALVNKCSMHNKWGDLRAVWMQTLQGTTLEDIKNNNIDSDFLKNNLI
mgnify:CR=1 FL=1